MNKANRYFGLDIFLHLLVSLRLDVLCPVMESCPLQVRMGSSSLFSFTFETHSSPISTPPLFSSWAWYSSDCITRYFNGSFSFFCPRCWCFLLLIPVIFACTTHELWWFVLFRKFPWCPRMRICVCKWGRDAVSWCSMIPGIIFPYSKKWLLFWALFIILVLKIAEFGFTGLLS